MLTSADLQRAAKRLNVELRENTAGPWWPGDPERCDAADGCNLHRILIDTVNDSAIINIWYLSMSIWYCNYYPFRSYLIQQLFHQFMIICAVVLLLMLAFSQCGATKIKRFFSTQYLIIICIYLFMCVYTYIYIHYIHYMYSIYYIHIQLGIHIEKW